MSTLFEREGHDGARSGAGSGTESGTDWSSLSGRHVVDEDAVHTPIFHALTRGGWRSRQLEPVPSAPPEATVAPDPIDEFRRDPLSAPIPAHALAWSSPEPASVRPPVELHAISDTRSGRHHRRRAGTAAPLMSGARSD